MIKADIVNRVTEESDLPRARAAGAVNMILEAMKEALSGGKRIAEETTRLSTAIKLGTRTVKEPNLASKLR